VRGRRQASPARCRHRQNPGILYHWVPERACGADLREALCRRGKTFHTSSLRPALASCAVSDKKRVRDRFCAQDATRAGSAANHSGSSPGSPWHRQLARSRRSLTFSASAAAHAVSAAAHAVSAAPALGGHPAGFLTSQSTAAVPRSCPASRTTPPPGSASGLHAPATQGPPQGREARHHVPLCQHCTCLSSPVSKTGLSPPQKV
jgi:hypothetical protein